MTRRVAAVVFALTLNPALVRAQDTVVKDTVLTITVPSADVYKGPSTVTPVIGHVARGAALPVSRNLGSWAKVAWPDAPDGVGYVHVTMGRLAAAAADTPAPPPASTTPARTAAEPAPAAATIARTPPVTTVAPPAARRSPRERMVVRDQLTGAPITHRFGVGGLVGSTSSFGATARAWHNDRLAFQLEFTRAATASAVATGRVTSIQFEPGAVYAPFDHVSDYVWFRPYVGSGLSFHHQTRKFSSPGVIEPVSDNGVGFRIFGGSELTFAGLPRFGVSGELGYRHAPTPFPGFETDRLSASIAGRWYIK